MFAINESQVQATYRIYSQSVGIWHDVGRYFDVCYFTEKRNIYSMWKKKNELVIKEDT